MNNRYLGTGDLEEKLVSTVNESLRKEPGLQVKWFLDKVVDVVVWFSLGKRMPKGSWKE